MGHMDSSHSKMHNWLDGHPFKVKNTSDLTCSSSMQHSKHCRRKLIL